MLADMYTGGKKIILASSSPRRRELLSALDIDFSVDTGTSFVEGWSEDTPHEDIPALMSQGKSMGFHRPKCWRELPFPSLGDLCNPGMETVSQIEKKEEKIAQ